MKNNFTLPLKIQLLLWIGLTHFQACTDRNESLQLDGAFTLDHDGLTREYIVHIPDKYDGHSAVPLFLNFHGFGGKADDFMDYTQMKPIADEGGFILVYPQGSLLSGYSHWNNALPSDQNKSTTDDFGFIRALLTQLKSDYNVDTDRVYATGYSNGGDFAYALGCYLSDQFTAIGSVAGLMLVETKTNCNPAHPTPLIIIHGTADNVRPETGISGYYLSISEILDYWTSFNQTLSVPQFDQSGQIERLVYPYGNKNTEVVYYEVNGGGHEWFSTNYGGSSTAKLIWDFVSRYDLNGLK